jgi:hypothetical protein
LKEFTARKNEVLEMYKKNQYLETANRCAEYIGYIDLDDFEMFGELYFFNDVIFNCFFRLSDEEQCLKASKECVRYATTDYETRKAIQNQIRLAVNIGKEHEALVKIEDNLEYFKSIDHTLSYADTLVLKGKATKDSSYIKEAIEIYKQSDIDTTAEQERAKAAIKALRHLS